MTTIRSADYSADVPWLFSSTGDASIAVAYVSKEGLDVVRPQIESLLQDGRQVRFLIDLQSGNTDPSAVWSLIQLQETYEALSFKTLLPDNDGGSFHAKFYVMQTNAGVSSIVGSGNLTGAALERNEEYGIVLDCPEDSPEKTMLLEAFESLWNHPQARDVDREAARLYELYCGRLRTSWLSGERRSRGALRTLTEHLKSIERERFVWPSLDAAYLMGAIAARGELNPKESSIRIRLLFRAASYNDGRITVRGQSSEAAKVLPSIPNEIATQAQRVLPNSKVEVSGQTVIIDLSDDQDAFEVIKQAFAPQTNCRGFRLPIGLMAAAEPVVATFVRGFSVASALLTDHTSMPRNARTGLPGQMVVWLRPKQSNVRLFNEMYELLTRRLGLVVYRHERFNRDPHLKILCEYFEEKVGFGIDWWDELVHEGASYNFDQFPQLPSDEE